MPGAGRLFRGASSGVITSVLNIVVLVLSYRLYLQYLGYERFGVWVVLTAVLNLAQLANLGLGPAVTKLVAEHHALGDRLAIQNYYSTACAVVIATGSVITALLTVFRHPIVSTFALPTTHASVAHELLPYVGALTMYLFVGQIASATLAGLGAVDVANYIQAAAKIVMLGASVWMLKLGHGIVSLLIANVLCQVVIHGCATLWIRRLVPLRVLSLSWDPAVFRRLATFGGAVAGGSVMQMFLGPFNKLIITRYVGLPAVSMFEISFIGALQFRAIIEMGVRAAMPEVSRASAAKTTQGVRRVRELHGVSSRLVVLLGVPLYAAALLFLQPFLKIWLGSVSPDLVRVASVMLVGSFVSLVGVPAFYTLMGMGRVSKCFIGHTIQSAANVVLVVAAVWLFPPSMLLLAAAGAFVLAAAAAAVYLIAEARRATSVAQVDQPLRVLLPAAASETRSI